MVTQGQQNLETVIFDYLGALREGDQEALRAVLDPSVIWQGLHEDWVCHGPNEVIETLQEGLRLRRDVSALEFVRAGTRLVMGVRGPSLDEVGGEPLGGPDLQCLYPEERRNRPHRGLPAQGRGTQGRRGRRGFRVAVEVADETPSRRHGWSVPLIDPRGHRVGRRGASRSLFGVAKGFREHLERLIDR
jgi:hypothetical protein